MLSSRVVISDLFRMRFTSYRRVISHKSSSSPVFGLEEREVQPSVSYAIRRKLCTRPSPDFSEVLNQGISSKFNLTKQIMIRGKAATQFQEELLKDFLGSHEVATPEEWHNMVTKILSLEFGTISDVNIDGQIMDSCITLAKLNLARSYLTYMKSQKKKFNGAVVAAFVRICFRCRESLTEQDRIRIKHFTDFLQKRYTIADSIICEGIVMGLVLQNKIDEAFECMEKHSSICHLNRGTNSAMAIGFFEAGNSDRAVKFVEERMVKSDGLSDEVYQTWIKIYNSDREKLDYLLQLFSLCDLKPSRLVCDDLVTVFGSLPDGKKLTGNYGTIDNRGKCSVCKDNLNPLELDEEEFNDLRLKFLNNVVVGDDVFKNTTPQELKTFLKLVESKAPFDIVIDGLNVAFMIGTKSTPSTFVNLIDHVVAHYRERQLKILLIGRAHMKKWANFEDVMKKHGCHYFLIHDLSEDDPFILYATMYSGMHANFITRDLFRSEKYRLHSGKDAELFKRWQQAHQIFISYVSPSGRVYAKSPLNFRMNVQRSKSGGWHIPYVQDAHSKDEYGVHRRWLCLH